LIGANFLSTIEFYATVGEGNSVTLKAKTNGVEQMTGFFPIDDAVELCGCQQSRGEPGFRSKKNSKEDSK
jgi:hypothetical protein